jgi:hypothetical protein
MIYNTINFKGMTMSIMLKNAENLFKKIECSLERLAKKIF